MLIRGVGFFTPFWTMKTRPRRSATSQRPSGRNATATGALKPKPGTAFSTTKPGGTVIAADAAGASSATRAQTVVRTVERGTAMDTTDRQTGEAAPRSASGDTSRERLARAPI